MHFGFFVSDNLASRNHRTGEKPRFFSAPPSGESWTQNEKKKKPFVVFV